MKWQTSALEYIARKNLYFPDHPFLPRISRPSVEIGKFLYPEVNLSGSTRLDFSNPSVAINVKKTSLK
jgi:hypothetical protein